MIHSDASPAPWNLPNALSLLRLGLVPVLLALAWAGQGLLFLAVLVFALATDVADGFLARALGQCSELGSKLDSRADLATWCAVPLCAWWLRPDFIRAELPLIALLLASLVLPTLLGLLKYGRLTSYHTWGAKTAARRTGQSGPSAKSATTPAPIASPPTKHAVPVPSMPGPTKAPVTFATLFAPSAYAP